MKKIITILTMAVMGTAYGQADTDIVNIPDGNFKRYLLNNMSINTTGDGEISYGEARAYNGEIDVKSLYIFDLTGIEAFVNITKLDVTENKLTSLDVSKNIALVDLQCSINQLSSLDISKNTALKTLWCGENLLTNLDVSNNTELIDLYCGFNPLTSLDVSNNMALQYLDCYNSELTKLDVSNNPALIELKCSKNQLIQLNLANGNNGNLRLWAIDNPNLMCIQIDKGFTPDRWSKDSHALYSDNCNYPTLSTTEVKAEDAIQILNPVKDNLIIKTTAKVEKIEIYNTAGQLAKVLFKGNTQVQDLAKGIYMVKVTTDEGVITQKIIKQ